MSSFSWTLNSSALIQSSVKPAEPSTGFQDLALIWDAGSNAADLAVSDGDLSRDGGLETAVILSLFLDRRAEENDVLPEGETDKRGWWADEFSTDPIGSRLWLLARSKNQPDVFSRAQEYATEALQWLVDDRVAESVEVTATSGDRTGWLLLSISITRPQGDATKFQYQYTWNAQGAP